MQTVNPIGLRRIIFIGLLLCLLLPLGAAAQDEDEQEQARPALPDIAPREVEIRGQLEISLPSLERQPLVGFERPPEVPSLPEDRRPYVEDYKQERSAQAQTLPGRSPDMQLLVYPPPAQGELEASAGRYFSRTGRARLSLPLAERDELALRLNYRGSDGFSPSDDEDFRTPFDSFEGRLGFAARRDVFSAGFDLDGFLDRYTLYGIQPGFGTAPDVQPDREGRGGGGALWLRLNGAVPLRLRAGYQEAHFETAPFDADASPAAATRLERRIDAEGSIQIPIAGWRATADALFSGAGLDGENPGQDVALFDGGAGLRIYTGSAYDLMIGARLITFSASPVRGPGRPDGPSSGIYISPDVRLNWYPAPHLTLYARHKPGAEPNALADLFAENPFLTPEPVVRPTVRTVDAEGGLRVFEGPLQFAAQAGFQYMPNYLFFEEIDADEDASVRGGLAVARYASARIFHAGADLALRHASGFHASLGGSFRQGRLTDEDAAIPYFAPFVGRALLSYAFHEDRGLVQLTSTFESARYIDREEEQQVDAFFDLDAQAAYDITPALGVVLRLENMSGALERWNRYPRPPFVILTGLRVRF